MMNLFEEVKKIWDKRKSCDTCTYHRTVSMKDYRGYMTGEMCKCKKSHMYHEYTDDSYICPCYKRTKKSK